MTIKTSDNAAKAKRTKLLRDICGCSRRDFFEKAGIPPSTQQYWENENGPGITKEGAVKLLEACKIFNVHTTLDWILKGIGDAPFIPHYKNQIEASKENSEDRELNLIKEELSLFREHYPDSMEIKVEDDSMFPIFQKEDWVAGKCYYSQDIDLVVNEYCIVLEKNGKKLLRYLKSGKSSGLYTLISANLSSNAPDLTFNDIPILAAAPVLLIRRKTKNLKIS